MTDVFISYKREDRGRVAPLAEGLAAAGLDVWWDRELAGGDAWRQAITENLDRAACVIVAWSEASVSGAGDFVQDEAARAKARGVLLPVKLDAVEAPVGFGGVQALDLVGWRGSQSDPRFQDVLAAARAIVAGGPRPAPKAPTRKLRGIGIAGGLIAPILIAVGFLADIAGLQASLCGLPGLHALCTAQGWGGVASPREERLWRARAQGDCEALRQFVAQFPNGAYAEEASRRLQAKIETNEQTWTPVERRLPLTVRTALDASPTEAAAKQEALARGVGDAEMVCRPFGQIDGFRLSRSRAEPVDWRCTARANGQACGFDGEAVCDIERLDSALREACP